MIFRLEDYSSSQPFLPTAMERAASIVALVTLSYLCLVRSLRWKRYYAIHKKYMSRFETKTLTPEEAQQIIHTGAFYDMPFLLNYSLAFALFKTYGIPSISKILAGTKELKSTELVAKRYADTEILISTWVACPISGFFETPRKGAMPEADPRAMIALSRTNWLHSRYNIKNEDYLYTLCLFIFEPPVWAARYGWRSLSPMECYAYYVFWVEIGKRMGIKDIPDTIESMQAWSLSYEETHMVPAQSNKDVAGYTTEELLYPVPEIFGLKNFFRRISICLLEERVRIAMIQPAQPWYLHVITRGTLYLVSFIQRWLCLPRKHLKSVVNMRQDKAPGDPKPRMYPTWWQSKPWYKPEATGIGYVKEWLSVQLGFQTEMPGPHLKSSGYRLEEMGPAACESLGHEDVMKMAAQLLGCPVTGPWASCKSC